MRFGVKLYGKAETIERLRKMADSTPSGRVIVFNEVPYAKYVEFGTMPHPIDPRTKSILRWESSITWGGTITKGARKGEAVTRQAKNIHWAHHVEHPGTEPNPFMRTALWYSEDFIRETIQQIRMGEIDSATGLNLIGDHVSNLAKELCPYKTGNLRRFIMWEVDA